MPVHAQGGLYNHATPWPSRLAPVSPFDKLRATLSKVERSASTTRPRRLAEVEWTASKAQREHEIVMLQNFADERRRVPLGG